MKSLVMVAAAVVSATLVLPTVSQARTVGQYVGFGASQCAQHAAP